MQVNHYFLVFIAAISIFFVLFILFLKDINLGNYLDTMGDIRNYLNELGINSPDMTTTVIIIFILIIAFVFIGILFSKSTKFHPYS